MSFLDVRICIYQISRKVKKIGHSLLFINYKTLLSYLAKFVWKSHYNQSSSPIFPFKRLTRRKIISNKLSQIASFNPFIPGVFLLVSTENFSTGGKLDSVFFTLIFDNNTMSFFQCHSNVMQNPKRPP